MIVMVNADTLGVTEYSLGVGIIDLVNDDGALVGVSDEALVSISGDPAEADWPAESPVQWSMATGLMDLSSNRSKRCERAYLTCSLENDADVSVLADVEGSRRTATRRAHKTGGSKPRNLTVKLPGGIQGVSWGFGLSGSGRAIIDAFSVVPSGTTIKG